METLVPAFLVLHLFGMLLWFGALLIQYVFLSETLASDNLFSVRHSMDLIHRTNKTFVNVGLTLSILTGILIIVGHGMEWFRPRMFVHLKLTLGVVAAGLSHMGMAKIRKAVKLLQVDALADKEKEALVRAVAAWRRMIAIVVAILATMLILAIFKFGAP